MSTPQALQYNIQKPAGFPSYIRTTRFTPAATLPQYNSNDTIRFEIYSKAFLDPYTTMLNFEVAIDPNFPIEKYQINSLDMSAHSLISEMKISCKGITLEYIQEYDTLATMLHDMNFQAQQRRSRAYEGHGSFFSQPTQKIDGQTNLCPFNYTFAPQAVYQTTQQGTYDPLEFNVINANPVANTNIAMGGSLGKVSLVNRYNVDFSTDPYSAGVSHYWQTRPCTFYPDIINKSVIPGTVSTSAAQYINSFQNAAAEGNTDTATFTANSVQNCQRFEFQEQLNIKEGFEPADDIINGRNLRVIGSQYKETMGLQNQYSGYINPKSSNFGECGDEPFFCGTYIRPLQTIQGYPQRTDGRTFLSFSIPLMSALLGVLMPPETYRYIPLGAFEEIIIEFKLNPYAFYTSGYKQALGSGGAQSVDTAYVQFGATVNPTTAPSNWGGQLSRGYVVTKMEIMGDLLSFDASVERMIDSQWQSGDGLILQSALWTLGPQYTFPNTAAVQGTIPINMGFNSLKSIIWGFLPLDYQKFSFCRKQYRISHNLTKFWLTLGQDLLPIDGVQGHAGTPFGSALSLNKTNKEFLINLWKSFNKLHDMRGHTTVNPFNFAINDRPYDPTIQNKSYMCQKKLTNIGALANNTNPSQLFNDIVSEDPVATGGAPSLTTSYGYYMIWPYNTHTAGGLPRFHEQRVVGRALYGFDTETLGNDFGVLSGLNTTDSRPFNINFEVDTTSTAHSFNRDSRMVMFFFYDAVVQLKKGQVPVVSGRA